MAEKTEYQVQRRMNGKVPWINVAVPFISIQQAEGLRDQAMKVGNGGQFRIVLITTTEVESSLRVVEKRKWVPTEESFGNRRLPPFSDHAEWEIR